MNYGLSEFANFLEKEYGFVRESNKVALREGDELISALQNEVDEIICDLVGVCRKPTVDEVARLLIEDMCGNVKYSLRLPENKGDLYWVEGV